MTTTPRCLMIRPSSWALNGCSGRPRASAAMLPCNHAGWTTSTGWQRVTAQHQRCRSASGRTHNLSVVRRSRTVFGQVLWDLTVREGFMLLLELDPQLLRKLRDEVLFNWFPRGVDYYNGLALTDYRELVTAAQDAVNDAYYNRQLAGSVKEQIYDILGSKQIMLQDGGHLRAARPIVSKLENVGWHREGMYGASPGEYNFWVPLSGVTTENSPLYIPGSDKIPDKDLTVMLAEGDPPVPANRIGLIPRPAIIVKGVDYSTAEP